MINNNSIHDESIWTPVLTHQQRHFLRHQSQWNTVREFNYGGQHVQLHPSSTRITVIEEIK